jgi:hypothetical protein
MPVPLRLTLRHVRPSQRLRDDIRERVDALATLYPRMLDCRVAVEVPHRHRTNGNRFHIGIEMKVPGDRLVISHKPATSASDEEITSQRLYAAVHRAFASARRRLLDESQKHKGKARAVQSRTPRRRS